MEKDNPIPTVIAINPGSRYLAIAILDSVILRVWRLKSIQGKNGKKKLEKVKHIIAGFIEAYRPSYLAIKKLHPSRSSARLNYLTSFIKGFCQKRRIKVFSYSIQELKCCLAKGSRINKKDLAQLMAAEYPELVPELKREERNKSPYFVRLFEAVALGRVCLNEINDNQ